MVTISSILSSIAGGKEQLSAAKSQVQAFQPEISQTRMQLMRQTPTGQARVQGQEFQRQQFKQQQLGSLGASEQELQDYEADVTQYLKTPSGIQQYASELGNVKTETRIESAGAGKGKYHTVQEYPVTTTTFSSPYGSYTQESSGRSEATANVLGKTADLQMQDFEAQMQPYRDVGLEPVMQTRYVPGQGNVQEVTGFTSQEKGGMSIPLQNVPGFLEKYQPTAIPYLLEKGALSQTTSAIQTEYPSQASQTSNPLAEAYLSRMKTMIPKQPEPEPTTFVGRFQKQMEGRYYDLGGMKIPSPTGAISALASEIPNIPFEKLSPDRLMYTFGEFEGKQVAYDPFYNPVTIAQERESMKQKIKEAPMTPFIPMVPYFTAAGPFLLAESGTASFYTPKGRQELQEFTNVVGPIGYLKPVVEIGLGAYGIKQQFTQAQIKALQAAKPEVSLGIGQRISSSPSYGFLGKTDRIYGTKAIPGISKTKAGDFLVVQFTEKKIPFPGFGYKPVPFAEDISPSMTTFSTAILKPAGKGFKVTSGVGTAGLRILEPFTGTYKETIEPFRFFGRIEGTKARMVRNIIGKAEFPEQRIYLSKNLGGNAYYDPNEFKIVTGKPSKIPHEKGHYTEGIIHDKFFKSLTGEEYNQLYKLAKADMIRRYGKIPETYKGFYATKGPRSQYPKIISEYIAEQYAKYGEAYPYKLEAGLKLKRAYKGDIFLYGTKSEITVTEPFGGFSLKRILSKKGSADVIISGGYKEGRLYPSGKIKGILEPRTLGLYVEKAPKQTKDIFLLTKGKKGALVPPLQVETPEPTTFVFGKTIGKVTRTNLVEPTTIFGQRIAETSGRLFPTDRGILIFKLPTVGRTRPVQVPSLAPSLTTLPKTKTKLIPTTIPETKILQIPEVTEITKITQIPKSVQIISPVQKTVQRQAPVTRQVTRLTGNPYLPPFIPSITPPGSPPYRPFGTKKKLPAVKKTKVKVTGFIPEIRRRGKFKAIAPPLPMEKAISVGIRATRRTLGASLRIRKMEGGFLPLAPTAEFRLGKEPGVIVQRRARRLVTTSERRELQAARRAAKWWK